MFKTEKNLKLNPFMIISNSFMFFGVYFDQLI